MYKLTNLANPTPHAQILLGFVPGFPAMLSGSTPV